MSNVSYTVAVDRLGQTFDVQVDYFIDPYYDPETPEQFSHTQWLLSYTPAGQSVGFAAGGEAEEYGFVSWPLGLSSGAPQQGRYSFEASNTFSGESIGFSLAVFDAALATDRVHVHGTADDDLVMTGSHDDRASGGGGNDWIDTGDGHDVLIGEDGDDRLDGGVGADRMIGGAGNDSYVVDDAGDRVIEEAGGGTDRVTASISLHLSPEVEDLTLVGVADLSGWGNESLNHLRGNDGANLLFGRAGDDQLYGGASDDKLDGGVGDDVLDGGSGDDRMVGGTGNDSYVVDSLDDRLVEAADGGVDTIYTSLAEYRLGARFENLTLTSYGGRGIGNAGNNILIGGLGNDVLIGGDGDDLLSGYVGADRLRGGAGADVFRFDDLDSPKTARDTILDFSQADGDRIDLTWIGGLSFRGEQGFSGAGREVIVRHIGGDTYVDVDQGTAGVVAVSDRLDGEIALTAGDFLL